MKVLAFESDIPLGSKPGAEEIVSVNKKVDEQSSVDKDEKDISVIKELKEIRD